MAAAEEVAEMVNATFSKAYLFKLLGSELADKRLADQIYKMGLDLEASSDEEITIDFPANRLDLIEIVGFARALRNFMRKGKAAKYEIKGVHIAAQIEVDPSLKDIRPFISAMVVEGIKFNEQSLKHLLNFAEKFTFTYGRQRKKLALGLHNLDTMGTDLRYEAAKDEEFVPLNSKSKMHFSEVLKKTEKGAAYSGTIGGASAKSYPVLRDSKGVISLIPIINSERTKVDVSTKNLFIEITGTSKYTVEKSVDLFAALFIDMGAKVSRVKVSYKGTTSLLPRLQSATMDIPLLAIEGNIGVIIGFNNVISLANKMGYKAGLVGKKVRFWIPEYRLDILNQQDVIEDIAIAYGYDYIQPVPIYAEQAGEYERSTIRNQRVSELMMGLGFSEAMNTHMTNEASNFSDMRLKASDHDHVTVRDAKVQNITMLRTWLLPSLLRNLGASAHEKMPQKIFELDLTFIVSSMGVEEKYKLAGVITDPKSNFNQMKAIIEEILYDLGSTFQVKQNLHSSFIDGRCASVRVDGREIGVFGELHPEVLGNFGIEEPSIAFEIELW
ncbi:MAG: phenylalanine--tRNA ligase subunit beta [Candidatus Micrarchaeota archaeon]|nr:phenylalanine--tRNA ligase subunit beta [Candidatus Micrarchaeota archaeon]MDE1848252.1 phenylalanine--tRNA ligase subunit beta [Candidatus Micrarchaeota archaeon]MDE1864394.1 phenylalanine--tRNA ligase subunit beta [Candidatus Micrarchaeota archaeon]